MIHLSGDIWLDADKHCYSFCKKGVRTNGKRKGEVVYDGFSHHATPEQVSSKIVDLGMKEFVNGDWERAYSLFNEAHTNFVNKYKELEPKRYPHRV